MSISIKIVGRTGLLVSQFIHEPQKDLALSDTAHSRDHENLLRLGLATKSSLDFRHDSISANELAIHRPWYIPSKLGIIKRIMCGLCKSQAELCDVELRAAKSNRPMKNIVA